ncbi:MAG: exosortase B [Proteobacteria bacterium]|nr:exosortase B [Pseudomonadota bacterium]HQR03421.1 exosortase B [Rhodocyclaceae bacterium]
MTPSSVNGQPSWHTWGHEWGPVIAGLLILYIPVFYVLATTIWQEPDFAHGPIILAVILWLLWERRSVLVSPAEATTPIPGFFILLPGLLIYALGRAMNISILEVGSLIPVCGGTLLSMRGKKGIATYWFLLLFLIYLIPLPGIFVDGITGPLKKYVSMVAEQILYTAGYPVARNGVILTIGQYQLLVADACSGINSMFSLTAIGLLYLYLMQRKSWVHNGVMLASLLPVAFAANIVRVVFLSLVTYHWGDAAGQGFLHEFSGMVLFIAALLTIFVIDIVLIRIVHGR